MTSDWSIFILRKKTWVAGEIEKAKVAYTYLTESDKSAVDISKADTLIAQIQEIYGDHAVTVNAENVTVNGVVSGTEYEYGTPLNITITPQYGRLISTVTVDGESIAVTDKTSLSFTLTVTKAHTISVTTELAKFAVTYTGNNMVLNGISSGSQYFYGETLNGTVYPAQGYEIVSITIDGVAQTITNQSVHQFSLTVSKAHNIVVTTAVVTYNVTVNGQNFTVNGIDLSQNFDYGAMVVGSLTANSGYKLTAIKVNGVNKALTSRGINITPWKTLK